MRYKMPNYDFKCYSCGHIEEFYIGIKQKKQASCSKCGSSCKQYFGNSNIAFHGLSYFIDPRGGSEKLTMAHIKDIEKKEGLTYLSHSEHDKEIAKNKKNRESQLAKKNQDIAEKATIKLMKKWNK